MVKAINVFVIFRILIGALFIVSGSEKAISPYQNFLYVIQNYEVLPSTIDVWFAKIFPWIELFVGIFLVFGLWLKWSLRSTFIMFLMFICVVSQALIRNLPIVDCGCFGDLIHIPLHVLLIFDCVMILLVTLMIKKFDKTKCWSLDSYFDKIE